MRYKKSILIVFLLSGFILFLSRCINQSEVSKDPRGRVYAGSASCRQCHQAIYDSFISTGHFKATSKANAGKVLGNFHKENGFVYDSLTKIVMEKRKDSFYQVLYENGKEKKAYPFDILFGYRHAQTSAYWHGDTLFELPISYYHSANTWATSPGYPADHVNLNRIVNTECLDCHSSGVSVKMNSEVFGDQLLDKNSLVYGIDCERCHGPAINHVNYHLENPGLKTAAYMVKSSTLSHSQQMDACGICHSGNDKMKIQSRFQFKMGDTLGYFISPWGSSGKKTPDVHGNQSTLLYQSKCFRQQKMTCGTCHDPHKNAGADLSFYSQKCMSCHKPESKEFCPKYASLGESIKSNCIDCHMPRQASMAIKFLTQGSDIHSEYLLRTHRIAVYNDSITQVHHSNEN